MFSWVDSLRRAVWRSNESEAEAIRRRERERREVAAFCDDVVLPALERFKAELEQLGRTVMLTRDGGLFQVTAWHERALEFEYSVRACRRKRKHRATDYYGGHYGRTVIPPGYSATYTLREIRHTDQQRVIRRVVRAYRRALRPVSLAFHPWGNRHASPNRRR